MGTLLAVLMAVLATSPPGSASQSSQSSPSSPSASAPTATFGPDGTLWVTWVDDTQVYVASSRDRGRTYSDAVPVNPEPEAIDANGESRPRIAVGGAGEVYVSYTRKGEKPYTGDVRFSRRLPGGRFSAPTTVNDDGTPAGHRFGLLAVGPAGDVRIFWIDKRDVACGAALYEAVSTDHGRTFAANRRLKEHVCECCRLALAWDGATPLLLWRDLYADDVRDHSLLRLEADAKPSIVRATDDDWKIRGCPHHGPALAASGATVHLAWFSGDGVRGKGVFYRRSRDGGRTFSDVLRVGAPDAARPQLVAVGPVVWLAWKEGAADDATVVRAMRSTDGGATWSPASDVARTRGASDHPLLISDGRQAFLSWQSRDEGYRVIELGRD